MAPVLGSASLASLAACGCRADELSMPTATAASEPAAVRKTSRREREVRGKADGCKIMVLSLDTFRTADVLVGTASSDKPLRSTQNGATGIYRLGTLIVPRRGS